MRPAVQHHVGRAQAAVDHAGRFVRISECVAKRCDPGDDLADCETSRSLLPPRGGERDAIDVFHADRGHPLVANEIKNANDIRMREDKALAGLALQILAGGWIETGRFWHQLERDEPFKAVFVGQPDHTHSPGAEDFLESEASEQFGAPETTPRIVSSTPVFSASGVRGSMAPKKAAKCVPWWDYSNDVELS